MILRRLFIPRGLIPSLSTALMTAALIFGCGHASEESSQKPDTAEPVEALDIISNTDGAAEIEGEDAAWVDAEEAPSADVTEDEDIETTPDVERATDTNAVEVDIFEPPLPLPTELGGERPAAVHLPENVDEKDLWPLVILLHGYTASGSIQDAYLGFSSHVTNRGFILVIPDGTIDAAGNAFWNATYACCNFYGSDVDDEGYLSALIDEAIEKLPVDPTRVSLFGHSNGGFMSFRMACTHADQIAAIGDIAGGSFKNASYCNPSEAVSVLHIHGTEDPTIPYNGGPYYPSALASVGQWVDNNGCDPDSAVEGDPVNYDQWVPGAETTATTWSGCEQGTTVSLWKMEETGHIPSFNEDFVPAVLDFLLAQSL